MGSNGPVFSGADRQATDGESDLSKLAATQPLSSAFAGIPDELNLPLETRFRVIVIGRQRPLKPSLREEAYRIGREAIANALRHSRAAEIETEIEYRPKGLRVAVRDNGRGMDAADLQWRRGGNSGLLQMRERANRIGARLRLWSRIAVGTEVELWVAAAVAFDSHDS